MAVEIDLKDYIRSIPDFPKPGIVFRDITPLLANYGRVPRMHPTAGGPISGYGGRPGRRGRGPRLHFRRAVGAGAGGRFYPGPQAGQSFRSIPIRFIMNWNTAATRWKFIATGSPRPARAAGRRLVGHRRHHRGLLPTDRASWRTRRRLRVLDRAERLEGRRPYRRLRNLQLIEYD